MMEVLVGSQQKRGASLSLEMFDLECSHITSTHKHYHTLFLPEEARVHQIQYHTMWQPRQRHVSNYTEDLSKGSDLSR